jgi:hypothetical protein
VITIAIRTIDAVLIQRRQWAPMGAAEMAATVAAAVPASVDAVGQGNVNAQRRGLSGAQPSVDSEKMRRRRRRRRPSAAWDFCLEDKE